MSTSVSGATLRAEREAAEVGQEAVARQMDVSVKTVQRIEKTEAVKNRDAGAYRAALRALRRPHSQSNAPDNVVPHGTFAAGQHPPYGQLATLPQSLRILAAEFELEAAKRGAPEWALDHFRYSLRSPEAARMFRFGNDGRALSADEQRTAMEHHIIKLRALLDMIMEDQPRETPG